MTKCIPKFFEHIPKFFDTDVFLFGGNDFTVSKWAFGKGTLLQIDNMEILVACEVRLAALKNIKAEIYAMQHKAYSRKQGYECDFSEKGQINLRKGKIFENLDKNL